MFADELREAVVHLRPHLVRHHRFERRFGHFDREIARAHVAAVDDRATRAAVAVDVLRSDEEACDIFDRLLCGGQADPRELPTGQRLEAFERKREVRAALRACDGMDLVDDHRAGCREHLATRLRAEQNVERLGRRDDDVRWTLAHLRALGLRRVARTDPLTNIYVAHRMLAQARANAFERRFEIAMDVVGERLERRDVHDASLVGKSPLLAFAHELIDRRHEGGERLARARGCRNQYLLPRLDGRPRLCLRRRRRGERVCEPARDSGMEVRRVCHGST